MKKNKTLTAFLVLAIAGLVVTAAAWGQDRYVPDLNKKIKLDDLARYLGVTPSRKAADTQKAVEEAVRATGNSTAIASYGRKDFNRVVSALEQALESQTKQEAGDWVKQVGALFREAVTMDGGREQAQALWDKLKLWELREFMAQGISSRSTFDRDGSRIAAVLERNPGLWTSNRPAWQAATQELRNWVTKEPERKAELARKAAEEQAAAEQKAAEERQAAIAAVNAANAKGVSAADFEYDVTGDGKGIVIKKYKGLATVVKIPAVIEGFPVQELGSNSFSGNTALTGVTIPDSVIRIGGAFYGCTALTTVTLPRNLKGIPDRMFRGCTSLTTIALPAGLSSIGEGAFRECTGLTTITLPAGLQSIEMGAFYGCTGLTAITLPAGLSSIGRDAFSGCTGLTAVVLPKNLRTVGSGAFSGCTSLASLTIQSTNLRIDNSFGGCPLSAVTIGPGITKIGGVEQIPQDKLPMATRAALNKLK